MFFSYKKHEATRADKSVDGLNSLYPRWSSIVRLGTASTFFSFIREPYIPKWVLPIQERPRHHYHTNTIPSIQFTFIPLLESFIFIPRQLTSFPSTFLLAFNPSKPPIFSSQNPWWDCGDKMTQKRTQNPAESVQQNDWFKMLSKAIIHSWKQMNLIWSHWTYKYSFKHSSL